MFWRKKVLAEYKPKELTLELLCALQGSLYAKLIQVNEELERRYRNLASLSEGMSNVDDARKGLADSADHLKNVNVLLGVEFARITQTNSN